ncbi:MAG TPA: ATP-binding cassette domain-containing protein [Egibacteraceae bacterium]|nr:ATP-binding cassette domain-containing protein [Egibacteraceae bacterium]
MGGAAQSPAVVERTYDDLDVSQLTIAYSSGGYEVRPIDAFDLQIASGQLVLLLGASGCGKTTLLSALASILRPTSGSIRVGDTEVTALNGADLVEYRRHGVGVVFQSFNLVSSLTASENVQVPLRAAGVPGRQARARAEELLHRVDMSDRLSHKPGDMSGGQAQRVAIARALAHDPPLVLADEPTAHLDYIQVDGVLRLLRGLAAPGRIVVVATHDERLLPLADRIVELTPRAPDASRPPESLTLGPGEAVFSQGDPGDLVYMVDEGEIEIVRHRIDGGEEILTRLGAGRYFGEFAPLFGLRRSATARAAGAASVTGYTVADFRAVHGPDLLSGGPRSAPG